MPWSQTAEIEKTCTRQYYYCLLSVELCVREFFYYQYYILVYDLFIRNARYCGTAGGRTDVSVKYPRLGKRKDQIQMHDGVMASSATASAGKISTVQHGSTT